MALAGTFSVKDQYLFFYSSCQHWKFLPTWMANKCIFTIVKTSNDIIEHFFLFPSGLLSFLHKISIQLIGRIGGQLKTELTRIIYVSPPLKIVEFVQSILLMMNPLLSTHTVSKFKKNIKLLPKDPFLLTLKKLRLSVIITYLCKRFWVLMVFAIKFFIGELRPNILLFVYMSDLGTILETTKKITLKNF